MAFQKRNCKNDFRVWIHNKGICIWTKRILLFIKLRDREKEKERDKKRKRNFP